MAADGSFVIDAKLDNKPFIRDSRSLITAINNLKQKTADAGKSMESSSQGYLTAMRNGMQASKAANSEMEKLEAEAARLRESLKEASKQRIATGEYSKLAKELEKANAEADRLQSRKNKYISLGEPENSKRMESLYYDMAMVEERGQSLRDEMAQLEATMKASVSGETTEHYRKMSDALQKVEERLTELRKLNAETFSAVPQNGLQMAAETARYTLQQAGVAIRAVASTIKGIVTGIVSALGELVRVAASAIKTAASHFIQLASAAARAALNLAKMAGTAVLSFLSNLARRARDAAASLARVVGNAILNGLKKIGSYAGNAARSILGLGKNARKTGHSFNVSLKNILKYAFGIRSLFVLFRRLRSAITDALGNMARIDKPTNKAISSMLTAFNQLKNALGSAFQPIVTAVAPYITQLLNMLSSVVTKLAEFFALLTGQNYILKATAVQTDYAKSLDKTKKSSQAATRQAKNQLAAFDQLNVLTENAADSAGSGGATEVDPSEMFEKINLDKITGFFADIKAAIQKGDFEGIGRIIAEKLNSIVAAFDADGLGQKLGEKINIALDALKGFVANFDWGQAARKFAATVNNLISSVHWDTLGETMGLLLSARFKFLREAAEAFDWGEAGRKFGTAIENLRTHVDWDGIGKTLAAQMKGALFMVKSALLTFDLAGYGTNFAQTINGFFADDSLWSGAGETIDKAVHDILSFGQNFVSEFNAGTAGTKIRQALGKIDWDGIARQTWSLLEGAFSKVGDFANALLGGGKKYDPTTGVFYDGNSLVDNITSTIRKAVNNLPVTEIGDLLGSKINGILDFMVSYTQNFPYTDIMKKIADLLNTAILKVKWSDIGTTLGNLVKGALAGLSAGIRTFNWTSLGERMREFFLSIDWKGMGTAAWDLLKSAFKGGTDLINAMLGGEKKYDPTTGLFYNSGSLAQNIMGAFNKAVREIPTAEIGDAIGKALEGAVDFASELVATFDVDTFVDKLEATLDAVPWSRIATKVALLLKDAFMKIAKKIPLIGTFIDELQKAGPADEAAKALISSLGPAFDEVAAYGNARGGGVFENFQDGFIKRLTGDNGMFSYEMRQALSTMFTDSEIESLERGKMSAYDFALGLSLGLKDNGEMTDELRLVMDTIMGNASADMDKLGIHAADNYMSSYILQTLMRQPDADTAVTGAFNDIWADLNADGNGELLALDYFNSFLGAVMDENHKVKPQFVDVVTSMFGSTKALEYGEVDAKDFLMGLINGMYNSSGTTSSKLIAIVDGVLESLRTDPEGFAESSPSKRAAKYGEDFLAGVVKGVNGEKQGTKDSVTSAFSSILDISLAMAGMALAVTLGMAAVKTALKTSLDTMTSTSKTAWTTINSDINTTMTTMKNRVTSGMTSISTVMKSQTTSIQTAVNTGFSGIQNSVVNNLTNTMTRVKSQNWKSIGQNIVTGIGNGMSDKWTWLSNTVSNLAKSALNAAKRALGIRSPSKLFRDEVGKMVALGMAEGIDGSGNAVLGNIDSLSDAMIDRLSAIFDSVTFRMPDLALGNIMPYNIEAAINKDSASDAIVDAVTTSNDDLSSVVIQAVTNATSAIVTALQRYSGASGPGDQRAIATAVIDEINRRTIAQGESPLLI